MGNKRKYFLYKETIHSTIDGCYHEERYYTKNKKLVQMKEKENKYINMYNISLFLGVASLIFCLIGLIPLQSELPILVLIIMESIYVPCLITCIILTIIGDRKQSKYSLWRQMYSASREYTMQVNNYAKQYEEHLLQMKKEKAKKLSDIYDALDDKELEKKDKMEVIAKLLDLKDL